MFVSFIYSMKHMFDYSGRARQAEYISFCLVMLMYIIFMLLFSGGGFLVVSLMLGTAIPLMLLNIAFLLAYLALVVRRLHDFDLSGRWVLLLLLPVPLSMLPVIGGMIDGEFWFYATWICSWAFFSFYRGVVGPNKYGPDPLDPEGRTLPEPEGQGVIDPAPLLEAASLSGDYDEALRENDYTRMQAVLEQAGLSAEDAYSHVAAVRRD